MCSLINSTGVIFLHICIETTVIIDHFHLSDADFPRRCISQTITDIEMLVN